MDNVISIELFKQIYKFKTDLDVEISQPAVEMLQNAVVKTQGGLPGAVPVKDQPIVLMMAALSLASESIRLKQQYNDLLNKLKSRSDNLIAKLNAD